MSDPTVQDTLTIALISTQPAWMQCLEQAVQGTAMQLSVEPPEGFTHWPPRLEPHAQLYLVDGESDYNQWPCVDKASSPKRAELVLLGSEAALGRVPGALRETALAELTAPPPPRDMRQLLRLWHILLNTQEQYRQVKAELDSQNIQVELLTGKLKRMEEWVDLLNRQRSSMGNVMEKFNMLSRLGQQINTLDVDQIARICIEKIPLLVDARWASLYLYDPRADELVLTHHNHAAELAKRVKLAEATHSLMAVAIDRKEVLVIRQVDDLERRHGITVDRPHRSRYTTGTCIVAPLISADRVVGVLNLTGKTTGEFFDELNDLPAIEHLSHLVAAAIRNCQLFREVENQARCDSMTGFLNHRTFLEELAAEIARAQRYGNPPSVIMLDCDKFKSINDTYGHQAGDHVIREIAQVIRQSIREPDKPCRYGGDEFAVIVVNSSPEIACEVAERILSRCRIHRMVYGEMDIHVTLSVGVCHAAAGCTIDELVRGADEALYAAKEGGRNRVAVHQACPAVG